jgi:WD40 repeat protein
MKTPSLLALAIILPVSVGSCLQKSSSVAGDNGVVVSQDWVPVAVHTFHGDSLAFSPDGETLATGDLEGGAVKLWNISTGKQTRQILGHRRGVVTIAYSPDGKMLASVGHDDDVKLWEVATGKERATLKEHAGSVGALLFAPNGKILATQSWNDSVKVWDLPTGNELVTLKETQSLRRSVLAFTPDSRSLLIVGDAANSVTLIAWDALTGRKTTTHLQHGHSEVLAGPLCMAFSPDGKVCAGGHGADLLPFLTKREKATGWQFVRDLTEAIEAAGTVKLWDVTTGKAHVTLKGHASPVVSITFTPDGKTLASGDQTGTVKLWEVAAGKERASFQANTNAIDSLTFSPDSKTLATVSVGTIKLWHFTR